MQTLKFSRQDRTMCRVAEKKRKREKKEKILKAFKGEYAYYNKTHTAIQKKAF